MPTNDDYIGREQSLVKHYILQHYLERFAHIIGSKWDTITYVDCFSGPWESQTQNLSDTSFAIALTELRKARDTLADRKTLDIRCLFLEENSKAYSQLQSFANKQVDVSIETRNASMLDSLGSILTFINAGRKDSFPFIFIDPTGWTGFDLHAIQPLLAHTPGEVLINFMTEHIRRFVTPKEDRPEIIDSFRRLFGTEEVFERVRQLENPQDREDELFTAYATQVRSAGNFDYTCPAVILHPVGNRTYFHLIYATRHRKGVEVFKQVEKNAFYFQEEVRAEAEERRAIARTGMGSLFVSLEQPPSHRAVALRERYLSKAKELVERKCTNQVRVPFDELWDTALAFPLVWDSDVKEWITDWEQEKRVIVSNRKPNQRVPQWGQGHVVEFVM